ncbi:hypothetical protein J4E83_007232 [Alternaria metachromatica]|uniref:uncharacterized protein n=1 Tax=Alternaria metachromatica TaxID=283354 RepID=UPI0020C2DA1B|nr:uncharacterized protein J4E83_007232 [Alternaria metachromatica]KAI4614578.1 hypothetical protein J4E83_007232 [Alternaria metachromatica]
MSALLQLPRELRDHIYDYYFSCDGGYTHVFETNKLRRPDDQPIEFSLVLSCRQIATETHGLALQLNTLQFATVHSDATQEQAGLHHAVNVTLGYRKESLTHYAASGLLSQEQAEATERAYPQFAPVVNYWRSHGRIGIGLNPFLECGEAPSIWRDFVSFTLDLVSQHSGFVDKARTGSRYSYKDNEAFLLNEARPEPWRILDDAKISKLQKITRARFDFPFVWPGTKYTYSAASAALRFLHSISKEARDNIRKVSLLEDRESVSFPESHGRGFILLCQKHPQLVIERSINLWGNVLPVSSDTLTGYLEGYQSLIDQGLMDYDRCPARLITRAVGTWIKEAMCLPELGMPHGSFTLVLDGSPVPEHSSRMFRVVQRDVAWQSALDKCYARGILPQPSWLDQRLHITGFMFEGLPEAVEALSMDSPLIRTNFQLSPPCDVEQMLQERVGWSAQDWEEGWATHEPREFQTEAPLPPWHLLRWRHVIR